jgi:hypothetical protein
VRRIPSPEGEGISRHSRRRLARGTVIVQRRPASFQSKRNVPWSCCVTQRSITVMPVDRRRHREPLQPAQLLADILPDRRACRVRRALGHALERGRALGVQYRQEDRADDQDRQQRREEGDADRPAPERQGQTRRLDACPDCACCMTKPELIRAARRCANEYCPRRGDRVWCSPAAWSCDAPSPPVVGIPRRVRRCRITARFRRKGSAKRSRPARGANIPGAAAFRA